MRRGVAVLIPCYNEEETIAQVVREFDRCLDDSHIYVFDNESTDSSFEVARQAGARVRRVTRRGKGHVVRRMFADIEADCYLLVDGDDTYDPKTAPSLVEAVLAGTDMAVARRRARSGDAFPPGHDQGNRLLTGFVNLLFGHRCQDVLSGYRAFSRRFAKSFPAFSKGFEIETELTVHALELNMPVVEIDSDYRARPIGSHSKLSKWRDGLRILATMIRLFAAERPFTFYGGLAAFLAVISLVLGTPVVLEWLETGLVPRFPTAILATGLMVLAALSFFSGVSLETVTRGRRELKMLAYLQRRGPRECGD